MQTGDGKQVNRPGVLKWFFDILRRLVPDTERNAADKSLRFRGIIQVPANGILHPRAGFLGQAQDRISAPASNQRAVLGVTHKEQPENVPSRQIRTHVKFARIPGRRDRLSDAREL